MISKALNNSFINHDEFVLINNAIKNITECLFIKQYHCIVWSVEKNTQSINSKVARLKDGRIMLLSKCALRDSKNSTFIMFDSKWIEKQEAEGL